MTLRHEHREPRLTAAGIALGTALLCGCGFQGYIGAQKRDTSTTEESAAATDSADPIPHDGGLSKHGTDTETGTETDDVPEMLPLSGALNVLDPSIIEVDGRYIIFHTGVDIPTKVSADLHRWEEGPTVFDTLPDWIEETVGEVPEVWAPDITYHDGVYYLYYGVSFFGDNTSCIGLATTDAVPNGPWTDQGPVVCSQSGVHHWNAIDPNLIRDETGSPWLVFGSYWTGIKMIALDQNGLRLNDELLDIASRKESVATAAPFVFKNNDYYYLFVSFDQCCVGIDSTHNLRVGRSVSLQGPYVDKDGLEMMLGGGSLLMPQSHDRWKGPGHNAVFRDGNRIYNVYHAYDAENDGTATLRIGEIFFTVEGWPEAAGP